MSEQEGVRWAILLEYDGTDFAGWQYQPGRRSVQAVVQSAVEQTFGVAVPVVAAGRTDAGVHAEGQVAHFQIPGTHLTADIVVKALNSRLPRDIRVLKAKKVDGSFHSRFSAISRIYRYRVDRQHHPLRCRYVWTPRYHWDDSPILDVIRFLLGSHSFASFSLKRDEGESYRCNVLMASWEPDPLGATFRIEADRFLHKMVRGLVGALIDLGRGYYNQDQFLHLLLNPQRCGAVHIAQPQGLVLEQVRYPSHLLTWEN